MKSPQRSPQGKSAKCQHESAKSQQTSQQRSAGSTTAPKGDVAKAGSAMEQCGDILDIAPELSAACVVMNYTKQNDLDLAVRVMQQLQAQQLRLETGSMADMENLLMSQAVALHAMFTRLAAVAMDHGLGSPKMHSLTGLSLRAQAASRASLAALAHIKTSRRTPAPAAPCSPQPDLHLGDTPMARGGPRLRINPSSGGAV